MQAQPFASKPWPSMRKRSRRPISLILILFSVLAVSFAMDRWVGRRHVDTAAIAAPAATPPAPAPISRDVVAECRELAPDDPYTTADARSAEAFNVCTEAAAAVPSDPEIQFKLGLAALQNDHYDEADSSFAKAHALGHCGALFFLGESAWYRRGDIDAAEQFYQRGTACGDARAAKETFRPEVFATSAYPAFIAALHRCDYGFLNRAPRFVSAPYVIGFYETLNEQFLGEKFNPAFAENLFRGGEILYRLRAAEGGDAPDPVSGFLYAKLLPYAYAIVFPELSLKAMESVRETARKSAHADVIRMVQNYKPKSVVCYRIVKGIEAYALQKQNLLDSVRQIAPEIQSLEQMRNRAWRYGQQVPNLKIDKE